jgi:hypothetical protein
MLAVSGCELQNYHSQKAAPPGCEKRLDIGSPFLWTGTPTYELRALVPSISFH